MASRRESGPAPVATSAVERAFQVAGSCATVQDIRRKLKQEGYDQVEAHLGGPMIRRQLTALLGGEE